MFLYMYFMWVSFNLDGRLIVEAICSFVPLFYALPIPFIANFFNPDYLFYYPSIPFIGSQLWENLEGVVVYA